MSELPEAGGAPLKDDSEQPATPRPAATVILLRRGGKHADRELEVLLVQRNPEARFMPGVWVFPGGAVDAADGDGERTPIASAAARELAEEAGIEVERRRARPLLALDHAADRADPLRHPLLPRARARPLAAEAGRLGDGRRRLVRARRTPSSGTTPTSCRSSSRRSSTSSRWSPSRTPRRRSRRPPAARSQPVEPEVVERRRRAPHRPPRRAGPSRPPIPKERDDREPAARGPGGLRALHHLRADHGRRAGSSRSPGR